MEQRKQRRPSRRSRSARAKWRRHIEAQRRSGEKQTAYCRARGLDPRYFSVWKGKLAKVAPVVPALVPVRIKRTATVATASREAGKSDFSCTLSVRLPNGVVLEVQPTSAQAMTALLAELARLPC